MVRILASSDLEVVWGCKVRKGPVVALVLVRTDDIGRSFADALVLEGVPSVDEPFKAGRVHRIRDLRMVRFDRRVWSGSRVLEFCALWVAQDLLEF